MNPVLASFTRSEKNIITFVLLLIGAGYGILEYQERQRAVTVFDTKPNVTGFALTDPVNVPGLTAGGRIDVNSAGREVLETLPGVGPSLADAIIRHRLDTGAFQSLDDLNAVPGIGPVMLEKLASVVEFGAGTTATVAATPAPTVAASLAPQNMPVPASPAMFVANRPDEDHTGKVNINTAGPEELDKLDGVGPALARRIIQDRQRSGPFRTADSLVRVKGIGPAILRKNAGRITVQ